MSDQPPPVHMPPVQMPAPRDHDDPTLSELVPFRSTKINLKKSPAFYFLIILALTVPLMFGAFQTIITSKTGQEAVGNIQFFALLMTGVICAMLQTMVFMYVRTDRSFLHYWFGFVAVCAILMSPLLSLFFYVFRKLWPFYVEKPTDFVSAFVSMFSGAGLMEELIKALPILFGAWIGLRMKANPALEQNQAARFVVIRGPLDGALMGVFAGGGFTFLETGMQYVLMEADRISTMAKNPGAGLAAGFILLIPRALGAAIGHMAYSGIFGYFIGLAVLKPKSLVKLLAIGWLASSTIHALWNSVGLISPILQFVIAGVSAVGLASVLLKARQIEVSRSGAAAESFGSIVVERPQPAGGAPYQPPIVPPVAPPAPAQPAVAATEPAAQALVLDVDGLQIPLRANGTIDLAAEPALGGKGVGVTGAIVSHPTRAGVLGLRNTGAVAWTARLRDGSQQQIEKDQNIRLAPGVTIAFGDGLFGSVMAAG